MHSAGKSKSHTHQPQATATDPTQSGVSGPEAERANPTLASGLGSLAPPYKDFPLLPLPTEFSFPSSSASYLYARRSL
ncbi:hypothetical protein N7539_007300 [Penicillium diatomitis]|uniref:Uncharacterized protein n=1 Tax=Penicillium diatomitis TaxID=2819901 RepID=A0A9X0BP69_9EURO|nr:uncharacterized protein N7539_007300 [Penicillium diatomitis]KAJ5477156.1 hypothetical protein N7539_007300 [Penicillium diatomitis]